LAEYRTESSFRVLPESSCKSCPSKAEKSSCRSKFQCCLKYNQRRIWLLSLHVLEKSSRVLPCCSDCRPSKKDNAHIHSRSKDALQSHATGHTSILIDPIAATRNAWEVVTSLDLASIWGSSNMRPKPHWI
jgi:hypothetical protein